MQLQVLVLTDWVVRVGDMRDYSEWWWWWPFPHFQGFWENVWPFTPCLRFFFFLLEISSCTLIPLFTPALAHSGSESWGNCGQVVPDDLRVSSFPDRFPYSAWTAAWSARFVGPRVYVCSCVTCHLHFGQNDRGLLHATAVTRGWNGHWIRVSRPWSAPVRARSWQQLQAYWLHIDFRRRFWPVETPEMRKDALQQHGPPAEHSNLCSRHQSLRWSHEEDDKKAFTDQCYVTGRHLKICWF